MLSIDKGLAAALAYGLISTSITFFNKAVLSVFKFPYPITLTLAQVIFAIICSYIMKRWGLISYADFDRRNVKKMLFPGVLFAVQVVTGLAAMVTVNVPMFGVLRRFTTFVVWLFELIFQNKRTPHDESLSLFVMLGGAVVAGVGDLTFDMVGYVLIALNCVLTAAYLVSINVTGKETGLNSFGLMFYNNVVSLPVLLVASLLTGELRQALHSPDLGKMWFLISFIASASLAFLLNYAIFLCTTVNSALVTSVTGQMKTILTTVIGLFMFGDVIITVTNSFGLLLGVLGSVWYSYIKYAQQQAKARVDRATNV